MDVQIKKMIRDRLCVLTVIMGSLTILILPMSCRPDTNSSNLENVGDSEKNKRTQPRYVPIEDNPGLLFYYRFFKCNNTKNIGPIREIITDVEINEVSRAQHFADNGLNKHNQYLDCLLWFHDKEALPYAQRNCGIKFFCSVDIRNQSDCVEQLNNAIKMITAKDNVSTDYLLDSPSDSNDPDHPVQKVCTTLYPRPGQY
ncbi:MAG: hypothetical protein OXC44_03225 [Proteobacteria bacterium]|nr:hypothetical protein [Pseudomonadota bacterium]